jgi:hypothetical protein
MAAIDITSLKACTNGWILCRALCIDAHLHYLQLLSHEALSTHATRLAFALPRAIMHRVPRPLVASMCLSELPNTELFAPTNPQ